jgi:hypothetical protein
VSCLIEANYGNLQSGKRERQETSDDPSVALTLFNKNLYESVHHQPSTFWALG